METKWATFRSYLELPEGNPIFLLLQNASKPFETHFLVDYHGLSQNWFKGTLQEHRSWGGKTMTNVSTHGRHPGHQTQNTYKYMIYGFNKLFKNFHM